LRARACFSSRAGEQARVRELAADAAHGLQRRRRIVHREHDGRRLARMHAAQQLGARRVAEVDGRARAVLQRHQLGVVLERDPGDVLAGQQLGQLLAHAPEAGDDHAAARRRRFGIGLRRRARARARLPACADGASQPGQQRRDEQRQAHGQHHARAEAGVQQPAGDGIADHDEGEFAALAQQQAALDGAAPGQAAQAQQRRDHAGLAQHQAGDGAGQPQGRLHDLQHVHAHAHRHEEQAHEQALERLDHQLDLVLEFRLGQQQAGDQRAQRHRQSRHPAQARDAEGGQQDQRHKHVRLPVAGEGAEQGPDHAAADQVDEGDGDGRLGHREQHLHGDVHAAAGAAARERADQDQDRHHGQVLEHQHGERGLAQRRTGIVALAQQLHDDGRRGQRQHQAQHQGRVHAGRQQQRHRAPEQRRAQHDLGGADAEYPAPHRPQARRRQLQADHEHQEQHAQLGEHRDVLVVGEGEPAERVHVLGHAPQTEGAEQGADGEEAQHRVDAQALQRGDQDAGQGQEQEDFPQKGEGVLLLHGRASVMTNRSIVNER
jgi:hypothetical protein